ncbi:MAG: STAS/SEC14 domain-containing protein [Bacteroidetes bacterium]|nr:STAS/SEC14 domain-containing protein [Bacteroidota bacterium]
MGKTDSLIHEYGAGFITLKAEGYFFVQMKENSFSTIETVKESYDIMASLCDASAPVYILVDVGQGSDSADGIYEYIAGSEFGKRVKAQAIIVHELAARLMGNLFLRYVKNQRHVKIFSKEKDAIEWLLGKMQNPDKNSHRTMKQMTFV